jgi:hypothetical protein
LVLPFCVFPALTPGLLELEFAKSIDNVVLVGLLELALGGPGGESGVQERSHGASPDGRHEGDPDGDKRDGEQGHINR